MTTADGFWAGKTVFVTGGASFIGSTLTDQLLARGAKKVRIVDDLTSGHLGNIRQHLGTGKVDFQGVFAELKRAGFHGPIMVECCALGQTPEMVTANARKNRVRFSTADAPSILDGASRR